MLYKIKIAESKGDSMLIKLVTHKNKGQGFGEVFSSLIGIMALVVVVLFFVGTISVLNRQVNIDNIVRGYMLQMEQQGCLTAQQQKQLKKDLVALGVYDGTVTIGGKPYTFSIKLEGWDAAKGVWQTQAIGTPAGYGNRVGIKITMTVPDNEYHPQYWLGTVIAQKTRTREVVITKVQTAKY